MQSSSLLFGRKIPLIHSLSSLHWFLQTFYMEVVPPAGVKKAFFVPSCVCLEQEQDGMNFQAVLYHGYCYACVCTGQMKLWQLPQSNMMAQMCTSPSVHNQNVTKPIFWTVKYRFQKPKILSLSTSFMIPKFHCLFVQIDSIVNSCIPIMSL